MSVVAAFLASDTADRVLRCINASVAVSASEIASMPLPAPDAIVSAMTARSSERALRSLYAIKD
jgi:adenine-specific DNA-methyltransferase